MKLDKQTIAWIFRAKQWQNYLLPISELRRNSVTEGGDLPVNEIYILSYFNKRLQKEQRILSDGFVWGFEEWHHSPNLVGNKCKCPKCNSSGKEWFYEPMEVSK